MASSRSLAPAQRLRRSLRIAAGAGLGFCLSNPAIANDAVLRPLSDNSGVAGLSIVVALVLITTVTALLHLTGRKTWLAREAFLTQELAKAHARVDRAQVFLAAEKQITIAWGDPSGEPDIEGDLSLVTDSPAARRVLGFGAWLAPETAQRLERSVERLRERGEAFRLPIVSLSQRYLEVEGRAIGGRAVMRIRDVSGDRLELTRLREQHGKALAEQETLRTLLDAIADPVWMRDASGRLIFVNQAYAKAVEAKDSAAALAEGSELLDRAARDAASDARRRGEIWRSRMNAVVAGDRHMLDLLDVPAAAGSAGIARDLSELLATRADLERQNEAHSRTLDQLATAVAIFDGAKRLVFHNAAYRQLWSLDPSFLEQRPSDGEILDRLRLERRLPEQEDFRKWKFALLGHYQSLESSEQTWHLPDGRTLRTVITPNPQGGVTYLFDNVTERYDLASRYNGLIQVQGETLDSLKEGVAVFGADGRLKLFNPAFARLWRLDPALLTKKSESGAVETPHIDQIAQMCAPLAEDHAIWTQIRALVAGLHIERTGFEERLERNDGSVLDFAAAPLPDGATLLTFGDISAGVHFERALTERNDALAERNQALVDAEKLRNDFVHHVSYELRSPLTNIIGFTQFLGDASVGPLNGKQREYVGYVMKSSAALLAIINDILDLATIDMDAMELNLAEVDIRATIEAAAEGVQDRLAEDKINLQIVVLDGVGTMVADGKRLRQVLFNLLSNAIGFSSPGQTVTLATMRRGDEIAIKVTDQGRGIPPDAIDKVFDRFRTDTMGSRHRGVGLGLSIVRSFVELHGGAVTIESVLGEGTVVTCLLPTRARADARKPTAPHAALELDRPADSKSL